MNYEKVREANIRRGKDTVLIRQFYDNNQLAEEGLQIKGKPDGVWKKWHPNGQPYSEGSFKDGKPEGVWKFWHLNGRLWCECSFQDGKRDGVCKTWDEKGNLLKNEFYKGGEKVETPVNEPQAFQPVASQRAPIAPEQRQNG